MKLIGNLNIHRNTYQWQRTLIIISCFFLVIMVCGFLIKDLNLEETDESEKNNEKKKSGKDRKKKVRLVEECSDLSNKLGYEDSYKGDSNVRSENVHLLNGSDAKNEGNPEKAKVSNQTSLLTSSSEDSYSLSGSSSSSESKSSSTSDLRTVNDLSFNEKLSIQFDKFDNILYSKCENDDDVFEPNLLASCNDLTANFSGLIRSNSTICLPTYLPEMYGTLKTGKEIAHGNLSTTTTPKLKLKGGNDQAEQLTSSQFHKDILLNLQKKFYFYKLINVYPYLFPECCRQQQCDCCADQIDQTVHSEKELYMNKSYAQRYRPPCIHSLSNVCDYDISYADPPNYGNKNDGSKEQQSAGKVVEFKLANDPNNNYGDSKFESLSPTTVSTITTAATISPANPKVAQLKPLPNKNVGQSLINSFVQLEPANYFRHMRLKRDSISYRSAMLSE